MGDRPNGGNGYSNGNGNGGTLEIPIPGIGPVRASGVITVVVVLTVLTLGAFVYFQDLSAKEHRQLNTRLDWQTCILSMTQDERLEFRKASAAAGAKWTDAIIRSWCPWLPPSP